MWKAKSRCKLGLSPFRFGGPKSTRVAGVNEYAEGDHCALLIAVVLVWFQEEKLSTKYRELLDEF